MEILTAENALALLTLTVLEIVLGIDNVIFISILVAKLEKSKQNFARRIGLFAAMGMRVGLLFCISLIMQLTEPLFSVLTQSFSGRDLILIIGGMFLIGKATYEIHENVDLDKHHQAQDKTAKVPSVFGIVMQILLLDVIFSLDSVITAVGMAENLTVMVTAVIISVLVMLVFAKSIGEFIDRNPTFKILALSFLLLIGLMLVADGSGKHVEKGYIYFAIGFSLFVEAINSKIRGKRVAAAVGA